MLWMNSKRTRRLGTFSKSLLVMFVAQLLLSAACISTANADVVSRVASATAHCHNESMLTSGVSDMNHAMQEMPACSHCDIPDMAMSYHAPTTADMVPVLLAIIELPEMRLLSSAHVLNRIDFNTPQYHFSDLYQTTQRILI